MKTRTVRDVIGEPEQWSNCIADEPEPMPYVNGDRILDVFGNTRALAIHLKGEAGSETLSVFEKIREALGAPI